VIINEHDATAADHESQFAEAIVPRIASAVTGSLSLLNVIPKKLPPVANPWLAEMDTETVMVAVRDTIWRYAVNGGVFAFWEMGKVVAFDAELFFCCCGGGVASEGRDSWIDGPETSLFGFWFADIEVYIKRQYDYSTSKED